VRATDLHKHFVDKIVIERDGKVYRRTPEVLDCWFESGSMPYAQNHYPFENREHFEAHFPADFIAEGLDQTRGWFYTLMVLSTAVFKCPPFRNVVVNGMVLAEDGRKMSKRLKNYPDPMDVLNTYGADALRLHMISSPAVRAEDLCFTEEGVKHSLRHLLLPWWNAYSFFVTYANIDGWTPQAAATTNLLDRWILSSLETLTDRVVTAMDVYDLQQAVRPFVHFIEDLTNWYIRRSRRRFWKSTDDDDKRQAYATLYEVLLRLCRIAAPFTPFISDAIYRNLRTEEMPDSVHLCDFPVSDGRGRDPTLESQMLDVMTIVSLGRGIRTERSLKTRQPLQGIHIACRDGARLSQLGELEDIVSEELNVRGVEYGSHEGDLVSLSAKADYRRLGSKLGAKMKVVAGAIQRFTSEQCEALLAGQSFSLDVEGETYEIEPEDVLVTRTPREGLAVAAEGDLVVALEVELNPDLIQDGLARELVNKVQNMRKSADLEVTQRIRIEFVGDDEIAKAVAAYLDYIQAETLALECTRVPASAESGEEWDVNGHPTTIALILVK
jgi:isoleucyl-tRNA synthetase